jgi:hypothetical protein
VAVVWQLGLLPVLGYAMDPYSILVPFLVFAIGMSHGAQKMNGIMQDVGRGTHKLVAARFTFRRLFLAGLTALLADAVGFAVLLVIDIPVIRELALAASHRRGGADLHQPDPAAGAAVLHRGQRRPRQRSLRSRAATSKGRKASGGAVGLPGPLHPAPLGHRAIGRQAALLGIGGFVVSPRTCKIGDLDPGAPELRAGQPLQPRRGLHQPGLRRLQRRAGGDGQDARRQLLARYETLNKVDALEWQLRQLTAWSDTNTLALLNRRVLSGPERRQPAWYELLPNQDMLNTVTAGAPRGLYNDACGLLTLYVLPADHKADTLTRVVAVRCRTSPPPTTPEAQFLLAAGGRHRGRHQHRGARRLGPMLLLVYAAVVLLCFITFRSVARGGGGGAAAGADLACWPKALMVALGMGVKVATLPVIALGRGHRRGLRAVHPVGDAGAAARGPDLAEAYQRALLFTGKVVP